MSLLTQRNTGQFRFNSLTDLRALSGENLKAGEIVFLSSATPSAEGSERMYAWNATSTDADDGEVTIKLTDTDTGRLKLYGAFLQSGTGATPRTLLDKAREIVSVTDFGADPTGVADSYAAFQACIDLNPVDAGSYAPLKATGGEGRVHILIPDGIYKISQPLNMTQLDYVTLEARGRVRISATHSSYIIDMSSADHCQILGDIRLESSTASVGVYMNRVTTNAYCMFNVIDGMTISITSDTAKNYGNGNIGVFNCRGEQNIFKNLEVRCDVPLWEQSTHNTSIPPLFGTQDTAIASCTLNTFIQCNWIRHTKHNYANVLQGIISHEFFNNYWATASSASGFNPYCLQMSSINRCRFSGSVETTERFASIVGSNYHNTIDIACQVEYLDSGGVLNMDNSGNVGFIDGDVRVMVAGGTPASGACIFKDSGTATTIQILGNIIKTTSLMITATLTGTRSYGRNIVLKDDGLTLQLGVPASGESSSLSAYLQGTFAPDVQGSITGGTTTTEIAAGFFTIIGRQVFITLTLSWTGQTGSGDMLITGLPFTSSATSNSSSMLSMRANNIALTAGNIAVASVGAGSTQITIEQVPSGGGAASAVPIDTAGSLMISGSYMV